MCVDTCVKVQIPHLAFPVMNIKYQSSLDESYKRQYLSYAKNTMKS